MDPSSQSHTQPWPSYVKSLPDWPREGLTYSYEHRGYIRPEKVELWLDKAFGKGKAKFVVLFERIYIKAPRMPTDEERDWMEDRDMSSKVYVEECGWLSIDTGRKGR